MTGSILPGLAQPISRFLARPARGTWLALSVAWAGAIFALSSQSSLPMIAGGSFPGRVLQNGAHAPFFALLGAFFLLSMAPGAAAGDPAKTRAVGFALLFAVLYGISDEWHQHFVPGRDASVVDVATDAFGAAFGAWSVRWAARNGDRDSLLLALGAAAGAVSSAALAASGVLGA